MTRIAMSDQPIGGGARDDQELVQPSGSGVSSSVGKRRPCVIRPRSSENDNRRDQDEGGKR